MNRVTVAADTSGTVSFHGLSRAQFDAFPGQGETHHPASLDNGEFWSKTLRLKNEGSADVRFVYFTHEAPMENKTEAAT